MSLNDYYNPDGGGNYLREGTHEVQISSHRVFDYNSGSKGVEFEVVGSTGAKGKIAFCLQPKILWLLANFSVDCGLTDAQRKNIDEKTGAGLQLFRGRKFMAIVEKQGKYCNIVGWQTAGGNVQRVDDGRTSSSQPSSDVLASTDTGEPPADDLPF